MNSLKDICEQIMDKDISINELYITYLIITDSRGYTFSDQEINDIIRKVSIARQHCGLSLEEIVDMLLDGYELGEII